MSASKKFLAALILTVAVAGVASIAEANHHHRQYYSSWSYQPATNYYYSTYYYQPTVNYTGYNYHYCIHYTSQPRYVYYYNPVSRVYWGRFDMEGKDGKQYSLLKEADRKEKLVDIPESAFPEPGEMPAIPDSKDGERIEPIKSLPTKDLPAK